MNVVGLDGGVTTESVFVLLVAEVEDGSVPSVLTNTDPDSKGKIVLPAAVADVVRCELGVNGITCSGLELVVLLDCAVASDDTDALLEVKELFSSAAAEAIDAVLAEDTAEPVIVTIPGFEVSVTESDGEFAVSEVVPPVLGGTTIVSVACDELVEGTEVDDVAVDETVLEVDTTLDGVSVVEADEDEIGGNGEAAIDESPF